MYDTIFAPITAIGSSAVTVFRVSGENSCEVLKILLKNQKLPEKRKLILKNIYCPQEENKLLDVCLICWMPNPNSYTGEDCFEIFCHGGYSTCQAFINALSKIKGLRFAEAGEFSRRALINGKIDLIKAEAINEIIISESEKQRDLALKQLNNGLSIPITIWKDEITSLLSKIEATIDFSDEEDVPEKVYFEKNLKNIILKISKVLENSSRYELISQGFKVVLTGQPNSGKSSLFNCIVKKEQSIVTQVPGTTRDVVEKKITYKGYQIVFFDTAGIRKTKNLVEREGIKKAIKASEEADLVLNIIDIKNKDRKRESKSWNVYNKIDKISKIGNKKELKNKNTYFVSAKTGEGVTILLNAVLKEIRSKTIENNNEDYFYTNNRQKRDLEKAAQELKLAINEKNEEIVAEHIRAAIYNLERILGKVDIEDVLGNIFENFCIGK